MSIQAEGIVGNNFKVKYLQPIIFELPSDEMYEMELNELKMKLDSELYVRVAVG